MFAPWPPGTVVALATQGDGPHVVPVSAVVPAGPEAIVLALARTRGSLTRLTDDPRVSVLVLAGGDLAYTAFGTATVVDGEIAPGVVAVRVAVVRVQDHRRPTFVLESAVGWRWTDASAQARDADVRAALERIAARA